MDKINHPDIILKRSPINTGFGAGNMNGYLISTANYVAFINNELVVIFNLSDLKFKENKADA